MVAGARLQGEPSGPHLHLNSNPDCSFLALQTSFSCKSFWAARRQNHKCLFSKAEGLGVTATQFYIVWGRGKNMRYRYDKDGKNGKRKTPRRRHMTPHSCRLLLPWIVYIGKQEIEWNLLVLVWKYLSGGCFHGFSIFISVVWRCFALMQSVHQHKTAFASVPLAVTRAPPAGAFVKMENSALLSPLLPLGGRWTVDGSVWLTQIFCLFGVFSMFFLLLLFRIYSLNY